MSSNAAELARKYLQEKEIPVLFESLMTALMYHKPDDPVDFMMRGLSVIKNDPGKITWDMFIDTPPPPLQAASRAPSASARRAASGRLSTTNEEPVRSTPPLAPKAHSRPPTAGANVEATPLPDVPIVVLLGGPGGRKSVVASSIADDLTTDTGVGIVHISVPDAIRQALEKYRHLGEWQNASLRYDAGQPIPDDLALNVVKAELSKNRDAKLVILDGYPRTLPQVSEFEREVRRPELAVIIDFDEDTLRKDLEHKELSENVIAARLQEYKNHTLPAAKHYDDALLLQLIAGEQTSEAISDQFKGYVLQTLRGGTNKSVDNASNGKVMKLPPRDVPVIVMVGAPGSLKSEYCRRLIKRYDGFVHLSMGELLKQRAAVDDPEGQEIADYLSRGELVPSAPSLDLMFKAMMDNANSWGFVIEGCPRDLGQAEGFDEYVDRTDMVLLIDCTEQFCVSNLRQRFGDDSSDEQARQRISIFKQHTLPMLKYYDEKGKLRVIEGDRETEEVFNDVVQALDGVFIPQGGDQ